MVSNRMIHPNKVCSDTDAIENSKGILEDSLEILNSDDPQPAPPPNNGRRRRPGWQRHGR